MKTATLVPILCLTLFAVDSLADVTVTHDNDLLTGSTNDRDYTGGVRVTIDRAADRTWQGGIQFYTPEDLTRDEVDPQDRPYANLIFVAHSREQASERAVNRITLSAGVIGSRLGASVFRAVHAATGSEDPNGYDNQISDGGEPTLRVGWTRYTPLSQRVAAMGRVSLMAETAVSVGYATDASLGVAFRVSKQPQWWAAGRDEFLAHLDEPHRHDQTGIFGGVRMRAVAYNALLQGQFRASRHTIHNLKRFVGEVWLGVTTHYRGFNFRYSIRAQSAEFNGGRHQVWGSLTIGRRFNTR